MIIEISPCHGGNAALELFPVDFVNQLIGFVHAEVSCGRVLQATFSAPPKPTELTTAHRGPYG
jgi:hypothetical protein